MDLLIALQAALTANNQAVADRILSAMKNYAANAPMQPSLQLSITSCSAAGSSPDTMT
jgi:hypothetical protein